VVNAPKLLVLGSLAEPERWRDLLALLQAYAVFEAPLAWAAGGAALETLSGDTPAARALNSLTALDAPPPLVPAAQWPGGVLVVDAVSADEIERWLQSGELWEWP
jgi:hypothetical protein